MPKKVFVKKHAGISQMTATSVDLSSNKLNSQYCAAFDTLSDKI